MSIIIRKVIFSPDVCLARPVGGQPAKEGAYVKKSEVGNGSYCINY